MHWTVFHIGRQHAPVRCPLPTVFLGFTEIRADTSYNIAEIVYREKLHLPGEFLQPRTLQISPGSIIPRLQEQIQLIGPRTILHKNIPNIFVHEDFESSTHVLPRIECVSNWSQHMKTIRSN